MSTAIPKQYSQYYSPITTLLESQSLFFRTSAIPHIPPYSPLTPIIITRDMSAIGEGQSRTVSGIIPMIYNLECSVKMTAYVLGFRIVIIATVLQLDQ